MERCVHNAVSNHLAENKKISINQAAYTPGCSTITQLTEIYHIIQTALDQSKEICFIFCDCSKAFDRVWHKGALFKLQRAGITGTLLKWFENYLNGRKQRVVINGKNSDFNTIQAGVPQGSILGPLIFLLYIDNLTEVIKTNIRLYADDSCIYTDYQDPKDAAKHLEEDISRIEKWASKWFVTFNPAKTESVTFSRKKDKTNPELKMQGTTIINLKVISI